jgi:hypothetical protein
MGTALLSTVVTPRFGNGILKITALNREDLVKLLKTVVRNYCGHSTTDSALRKLCPRLEKWDGSMPGIAVRPRGGIRNGRRYGDIAVRIEDLEAVLVEWQAL